MTTKAETQALSGNLYTTIINMLESAMIQVKVLSKY